MHARRDLSIVPVVAAALLLVSAPAAAQMAHIPQNDWRQPDRHDVVQSKAEKAAFAFELRFGPYLPNIDAEFNGTGPFARTFGIDCDAAKANTPSVSPRFYFGVEIDALPLRIPYVGMFGLGVGWGFTQFSNNAVFLDTPKISGKWNCSQQTTSLMIMPMHGSFVLRVDELMRRTGVPIVPYGKAGAGLAFWRASGDAGSETCGPTSSNAGARAACASDVTGTGLSPSLHFALGGMLALNFLEPGAAARLDETTGVKHAYAFGEWYSDTTQLSSKTMRVGASSWVVGLAFDM